MRRKGFCLFLFVAFCCFLPFRAYSQERSFSGRVDVTGPETSLLRWLVEETKPESARMILDGPIGSDGKVRHLYFEAVGPTLEGLRVESLSVETVFADFGPLSTWTDRGPSEIREVVMGYFDSTMTDSDINGFLRGMTMKGDEGDWESISVKFIPGGLSALGYYNLRNPGLKLKVELDGKLVLRDRSEIWLDRYVFKVNNDDQSSVVESALEKVQPIVDMKNFIFPVQLQTLDLQKGRMRLATRVLPKPFDGISLVYRSK
ncbi:Protein of unknown function [Dethiosulfovibrio salsuginis]|uniref:Outer membrane lipoprotein-sorting protein n=2 Tax=Dethiosulfovibrio salsuginis TaxID=561720 RepID=A0A1X7KYV7_9BACT|nr:Protein of unknown function [Dethiosulfovibrio salsuginis]